MSHFSRVPALRAVLAGCAFGFGLSNPVFGATRAMAETAQAEKAQAEAAAPTASHLAAAHELLDLTGISKSFAGSVPQFYEQIVMTLAVKKPEEQADLSQVFVALKPEFQKRVDDLTEKAAVLYAKLLSEDDLTKINAFLKTEPGRKFLQTQSDFMKDIVVTMEDWREHVSTDMLNRVRAEMQKKGHTL